MINIVLIEPEIPQNTGNIARTCTAIGAKLHIVKPIPFHLDEKSVRRAGLDYWKYLDIEIHESFAEFEKKYMSEASRCFFCSTKADKKYTDLEYPEDPFFLFGPESRGLSEDLIFSDKGTPITIPMLPEIRSLNLSNAVAIIAYEAIRQSGL